MAPVDKETSKQQQQNVLITGFGPFDSYEINPSWEAVKTYDGRKLTIVSSRNDEEVKYTTYNVHTERVPVSYEDALQSAVNFHHDPRQFPIIIHVGVGKEQTIALESRAPRYGYIKPDVSGKTPPMVSFDGLQGYDVEKDLKLSPHERNHLYSHVPVDQVLDYVKSQVQYVSVSNDPGSFLCGFLYYASLAQARITSLGTSTSKAPIHILFVHVPPLGHPYSQEELNIALWKIISHIIKITL